MRTEQAQVPQRWWRWQYWEDGQLQAETYVLRDASLSEAEVDSQANAWRGGPSDQWRHPPPRNVSRFVSTSLRNDLCEGNPPRAWLEQELPRALVQVGEAQQLVNEAEWFVAEIQRCLLASKNPENGS